MSFAQVELLLHSGIVQPKLGELGIFGTSIFFVMLMYFEVVLLHFLETGL